MQQTNAIMETRKDIYNLWIQYTTKVKMFRFFSIEECYSNETGSKLFRVCAFVCGLCVCVSASVMCVDFENSFLVCLQSTRGFQLICNDTGM